MNRYTELPKEDIDTMFNFICELIIEYRLTNILQLVEHVEQHPEYGLTRSKINSIAIPYSEAIGLYFDALGQEK